MKLQILINADSYELSFVPCCSWTRLWPFW